VIYSGWCYCLCSDVCSLNIHFINNWFATHKFLTLYSVYAVPWTIFPELHVLCIPLYPPYIPPVSCLYPPVSVYKPVVVSRSEILFSVSISASYPKYKTCINIKYTEDPVFLKPMYNKDVKVCRMYIYIIYVIKGYPKNEISETTCKIHVVCFLILIISTTVKLFSRQKTKIKFIVISNELQFVFTVSSLVNNPVS